MSFCIAAFLFFSIVRNNKNFYTFHCRKKKKKQKHEETLKRSVQKLIKDLFLRKRGDMISRRNQTRMRVKGNILFEGLERDIPARSVLSGFVRLCRFIS